jgi:hypothetical protein
MDGLFLRSMRIAILFVLIFNTALANDSLVMTQLLQRVAALQPRNSAVFPKGSIPSFRIYALNKDRSKADINPFYTGLVSFTLRDIYQQLSPAQRTIADSIIARAIPSFDKFRNRSGRNTYNFWPTDTPQIFPHAGWLNWFDKRQALPDDMDDTVIILMALAANDATAKQVHALMQAFANNPDKKVNNTFKEYKNIGAYSTWFGEKMPVDFDICVLANVLYFVQSYNLPWTAADSASLVLIEKMIADKKHVTAPGYVSPHYNRLPNLLYHISRLMSVRPIASLEKYREQLIAETQQALAKADSFMDEVILGTALMRWGVNPPVSKPRKAGSLEDLVEDDRFSFFIANMASMLPNPLKQMMGGTGLGKFYYHSPAYNNVLLLENLVWRKKMSL